MEALQLALVVAQALELVVDAQALELVVVLAADRYESPASSPQRGPAKWPSTP